MIGLIFGESDFPKYILKKIYKKKKYILIDLTKKKIFKRRKNSYHLSVGQIGKVISILKNNKCKKVLFAGKVYKPKLSKLKLDLKGIYYMTSIIRSSKLGDAAILRQVIEIFKKEKIQTLKSNFFTPELSLKKGNYTKLLPDNDDKLDIKNALLALKRSGDYTFSQGAVSRENKIIAIEGTKGTDAMLKTIKKRKKINKGVLVKFPKKKQDLRIDLPTIGLQTLKQCKIVGLKGIVLKHKLNIFLNKRQSIEYANKNKMFILVK